MPTKQWLQVEVDNEIVMYLLLSFISNLDFKPFLPIEATSETVYYRGHCKLLCRQKPFFTEFKTTREQSE